MNDNLTKLNLKFERSKLLRTKLNEEMTKMGGKTYIISSLLRILKASRESSIHINNVYRNIKHCGVVCIVFETENQ